MAACTSCASVITAGQAYCSTCGKAVGGVVDDVTLASDIGFSSPPSDGHRSTSVTYDARFVPGTLLAGRYRIVALIGRGGMGEVYRADDLKLGQAVALKFLPADLGSDARRLQRFLDEARMALRVTHPNVCRVYDISEVHGQHFITMEYVDGDDLASLLRRVGHFPEDKAVEVARQLCAGLTAAHDQNILHRDLKPANVLLDGRGRVRITDFGLAALEGDATGPQVRGGTPGYMAPELWTGSPPSVRSDLYALGLVLYELFTGKSAFSGHDWAETERLHRESAPPSPTTLVEGLDPALERVILRCLEKDPEERPQSARAVAAALPGGDPLAAALAAGELPSPDLLARAGGQGGLRPAVAWAGFGAILIGIAALVGLAGKATLVGAVHRPKSTAVLAERAREILRTLGHEGAIQDEIYFFEPNVDYIRHFEHDKIPAARQSYSAERPSGMLFWYRSAPQELDRVHRGSIGDWRVDPPLTTPGMSSIGLDPAGRLFAYLEIPADKDSVRTRGATDWTPLFAAADLDPSAWSPVEPEWNPPVFADQRAAWQGTDPRAPEIPLRIETASLHGKPVAFRVIEPWTRPFQRTPPESTWDRVGQIIRNSWFVIVLIAASIAAFRNVRSGRGDRRGALRLAIYLGAMRMFWYLGAHHTPSRTELDTFTAHLAWSCYRVCLVWVFYLALEPFARRAWPRMMISWVRLLSGRFRDPLVGRDLLMGIVGGVLLALIIRAGLTLGANWVTATPQFSVWSLEALRGPHHALVAIVGLHVTSVLGIFVGVMFLLMLKLLLRRTLLTVIAFSILSIVMINPDTGSVWVDIVLYVLVVLVIWVVLLRFGFLGLVATSTFSEILSNMPLDFDVARWDGYTTLWTLAVVLGLAIYALRSALRPRLV